MGGLTAPRQCAQCHAALGQRCGACRSTAVTVVALQIFSGRALTPLSQPLPFFAYPFLAATLFGWAWTHYRDA
jgi:hypothetical protein